ncbi:hypothetical protein V5O48_012380 [Marasmius crinis-equi]|uniref:Uncharacterized protein n=1 Tax=Marasmius crinis-equi TaxID=585013 RepID=A0ABR3F3K0_9AGAR
MLRIFHELRSAAAQVDPSTDGFVDWLEYGMQEIGGEKGRSEEGVESRWSPRRPRNGRTAFERAPRDIPPTTILAK